MLDKLKAIAQSPSGRRLTLIADSLTLVVLLAILFGQETPWYMRALGVAISITLAIGILFSLPKKS